MIPLVFISNRYKLVFLEIQRTGSNSITRALTQIDPDSPTVKLRKDNWAIGYHDFHIPAYARDYRIVGTHRNPYTRLWSHWKHRHRIGNPPVFKSVSWPEYIDWTVSPRSVPRIQNATVEMAISEMENTEHVDHWLRFANLAGDWLELSRKLKLPLFEIGRLNTSSEMGVVSDVYDADLAARVYERFKKDFTAFGYASDSWSK